MLKQQDKLESTKEHKKRHPSRKRGKDEKKHEHHAQSSVNPQGHMVPPPLIPVPVQQPVKFLPPAALPQQSEPEAKNDYVQIIFDANDLPPPPTDPVSNTPAGLVSPLQPSPSPGLYTQPATPTAVLIMPRKSDTSDPAKGQQHPKKPTKSKSSSSNNDEEPDSDSNSSEPVEKDRKVQRKGSIREIGVVLKAKKKKHANAKSIKAIKAKKSKKLKKSGSK